MSRLHALFLWGLLLTVATSFASTLCACGSGRYPTSTKRAPREPPAPYPRFVSESASEADRAQSFARARSEPQEEYRLERYGFWVGAMDTFTATLVIGALATDDDDGQSTKASNYLRLIGVLGYAFASPILHQLSGNGWGSGGSFLLRTTLPLLSTLIVEYTFGCEANGFQPDCEDTTPYGLALGAGVATALDAVFLARRWRPIKDERASGLRIHPVAIVGRERKILGLGFSF